MNTDVVKFRQKAEGTTRQNYRSLSLIEKQGILWDVLSSSLFSLTISSSRTCPTTQVPGHLSVLKDRKRLFLDDTHELTFSQGRGTG